MATQSLADVLRLYEQYGDDVEIVEPGEDDLDSPARISKQRAEGVKRGQLWMAKDQEGHSSYVLVTGLGGDPRTAVVVPLSNDAHDETADSIVVEEGAPLGVPMVAWPAFKAVIPIRTLFKPLKEFSPATVDALEANDPSKADPADAVRAGVDPQDEDSPAFDDRNDIVLTMALLHAHCDELPALGQLGARNDDADDALEAYSQALQDVLKLKPQVRLAVIRGNYALNAAQQRKMAAAGFPAAPQKSKAIPDDYLILAEQPEFYETAAQINPEHPEQARLDMARKAAYGLAARTTGHGEAAMRGAFQQAAEQLLKDSRKGK